MYWNFIRRPPAKNGAPKPPLEPHRGRGHPQLLDALYEAVDPGSAVEEAVVCMNVKVGEQCITPAKIRLNYSTLTWS